MRRLAIALIVSLAVVGAAVAQVGVSTILTLLSNASATGTSQMWPGGGGVFAASGTFNGATVTLQFLGPDGSTMIAAGTATTLTANGAGVFYLPKGFIQAAVSGGTPSALYATAKPLPTLVQ